MSSANFELLARPSLSWLVFNLTIEERVSKLSKATALVSSPGLEASDLESLLGHPAMVSFDTIASGDATGAGVRRFHGVVTKVERRVVDAHHPGTILLTVRPTATRLKSRRTSRVFHDVTAVQIVEQLCGEHRITLRKRLRTSFRTREYSVQYRETDYAFMRRLLAEEGVFFFFDHPAVATGSVDHTGIGDRDVLVLADYADAYPKISLSSRSGASGRLTFRPRLSGSALLDDDEQVHTFFPQRTKRFEKVTVNRHDFNNPVARLLGEVGAGAAVAKAAVVVGKVAGLVANSAEHQIGPSGYYEHLQDYEEGDTDEDDVSTTVGQLRRGDHVATGASHCPSLCAGFQFELEGHPEVPDGSWAVTLVKHRFGHHQVGKTEPSYSNTFTVVPATVPFRPKPPKRKVQQTLETAVVTGTGADDIHTDSLGRIRIRFHWELDSEPEHSSCWVRVTQAWAGAGFGSQFIPRVGMEVAVAFLGGDVDRPIVIGALPNAVMRPPFSASDGTRSGIRTRTTPHGAGHNELSFEDRAGSEQVLLVAEREFQQKVGEDAHVSVGRNREATVEGDESVVVSKQRTVSVGGDQSVTVTGTSTQSAGGAIVVGAASRHETIKGLASHRSATALVDIEHGANVMVGGNTSVSVGTRFEGGDLSVDAGDSIHLQAKKGVHIYAQDRITFSCGPTRLSMDRKGLYIDGRKVQIQAKKRILLSTSDAELFLRPGKLEGLAKKVGLESEGASFLLDEDAHVDGTKVRLNCGSAPLEPQDPDEPTEETKLYTVIVRKPNRFAPGSKPYADCRYEFVCDGRRFRGKTDGAGRLTESIPKSAKQARLTLWPKGVGKERVNWKLDLTALQPIDTVQGVQERLRNLGIYNGTIDGEESRVTRKAIDEFQRSRGLPRSAERDPATIAALGVEQP